MRKEYSLKRNEEISKIVHSSKCIKNDSFVIYIKNNEMDHARVCISVSKKLGKAHLRNKTKRQVRMMITEILNFEKLVDLVIVVRKKYFDYDFVNNKANLQNLISRI